MITIHKEHNLNSRTLRELPIEKVMSTEVITIRERASLSQAEEIFVRDRVYYLPVVNDFKELVGIITQKYLYKTQSPRKSWTDDLIYVHDIVLDGDTFYPKDSLDQYKLSRIMKENPFTMREHHSVADAVWNMTQKKIGCIPIIDKGRKVKGILTAQDIVRLVAMTLT